MPAINENIILKSKKYKIIIETNEDISVPDQVFLGLTDGSIKGPLTKLPNIQALVSFKNDNKKQRYKISLSITDRLIKKYKKIIMIIGKKLFT